MAKDLRFVDPAFGCKVVLSGAGKALYEAVADEFERLKGIRSLGLGAYIREVGIHARHDHAVGLIRIFNKLCQQPRGRGLPKSFVWSFWPRLCFAQTGHAALSYDAEKAVLLACHLDSQFKGELRALLQPAIDKVAACGTCGERCPVKEKAEADKWFEQLVSGNQWERLHLWIAAVKLVQRADALQILGEQRADRDDHLGFSEPEAFNLLVAPDCKWIRPVGNLIRMDFIVRDLAFAGTLGIQLDVDSLVSAANLDDPDWGLLSSLARYLRETVYESLEAQTASVLFQRALAAMLIRKKVRLEQLFGIDISEALSDDELSAKMKRTAAGREVFDRDRRRSWRAWRINTFIDPETLPCGVEGSITGYRQGHLSHHTSVRATCFKMREKHSLAIAMSHRGPGGRPSAKAFVKLCRSILKKQYPLVYPWDLIDALFEGLLDRSCEHRLHEVSAQLSKLGLRVQQLRRAANVVNKHALGKTRGSGVFSFKIVEYEYPVKGYPWPLTLNVNLMHAALRGGDSMQANLGITAGEAAETLWEELLLWQSEYFGSRRSKWVSDLVAEAQANLATKVIQGGAGAASDLELYALLEALRHPKKGVSFRITLPNLRIRDNGNGTEAEYDVVSVVLKNDKDVEIWVWGVTTEANLQPKRTADLGKIERFKDLLGERWGNDVRVATCYVHRDGNCIRLDIDGRRDCRCIG